MQPDDAVLAALLTSSTKAEAGNKIRHVSQRTVYQLLQDPEFAKRYADAR